METGLLALPVQDVLFACIFSHLHPLEVWGLRTVCKRLHSLCTAYFTSACTRLYLNSSEEPLWTQQVGAVRKIASICNRLKEFSLVIETSCHTMSTNAMQHDNCIMAIPVSASLRVLRLSSLHLSSTHMCIKRLKTNVNFLRVLHLESIENFNDTCLLTLLSSHPSSITELFLINLPLLRNSLPQVIASSKQLQVLSLKNTGSTQQVALLEDVLKGCTQLHTVTLSFLSYVTERMLHVMAEYCRSLRHVTINHCPAVSTRGLQVLAARGITVTTSDSETGSVEPATTFEISQI